MKKKSNKVVLPQYVKNDKGKVIEVYIPIDTFELMQKRLKEWDKIKNEEGVKWVYGTTAKEVEEKSSKKSIKKGVKKPVKKIIKKTIKKTIKKSCKKK